jgi:hypothetical protein
LNKVQESIIKIKAMGKNYDIDDSYKEENLKDEY